MNQQTDLQRRVDNVLLRMKHKGLTQLLVADPNSVWYLTGVDVAPGERLFVLLLRADGEHTLFVNRLFSVPEDAPATVWFSDTDDAIALLAAACDRDKPLGIDKIWPARFLLPLQQHCPHMQTALGSDCVDDCRAVKDARELKLMREASAINDRVMKSAADFVREGMTEREVAAFIDNEYQRAGCSGPSFPTIVSFGAHAADPHHEPDNTVLRAGDCVLLDIGCIWQRYCSDMTRTYFCKEAEGELVKIHDLVRAANEAAEAAIRPGVPLRDIDAAARNLIAAAGYGDNFFHRLGHFIGQEDHEQGDVSAASDIVAQPGMVFSIEPGIYLPGVGGVRIEDLVIVTEEGCEVLNRLDKGIRTVG